MKCSEEVSIKEEVLSRLSFLPFRVMKKVGVLAAVLMVPLILMGQPRDKDREGKRVRIGVYSGAAAGWWLFKRPVVKSGSGGAAWDRTDFSLKLPLSADLLYTHSLGKVGVGYGYSWLFDSEMELYEDSYLSEKVYRIAEVAVKFESFCLEIEPYLVKKEKFALSPYFKGGTFRLHSLHPDRNSFGDKWLWECGLSHEISLSRMDLVFIPRYQNMTILPKGRGKLGGKHFILSMGIYAGLRFRL